MAAIALWEAPRADTGRKSRIAHLPVLLPRLNPMYRPHQNWFRSKKLVVSRCNFFLNCFPAEKAGTLVAGMSILSPVLGLRPSRALLPTSKEPKPTSVTLSPEETASMIVSKAAVRTASACFFVTLALSATASTSSPCSH